jgi:hypothetical protein
MFPLQAFLATNQDSPPNAFDTKTISSKKRKLGKIYFSLSRIYHGMMESL